MPLAFTTGTSSHPKNTLQKRKFKFKVLVLLHVLIPGVMLSSLETINPWLSACDLAQAVPPDLQGTCSATQHSPRTTPQRDGELSCPKKCAKNHTKTDTENPQCLFYLDEDQTESICSFKLRNKDMIDKIKWLTSLLQEIRLRHCCEHKLNESLSDALLDKVYKGGEECRHILNSLMDVDNLAARVSCEFNEVLSRFDCGQSYSVRFTCEDCKEAYRRWVCSSMLPFFNGTQRIRPCRSVCQAVEQKCPYFLPENRAPSLPTQYAGEPTFLCVDPNIPEIGEQQRRSLYPEKGSCCVHPCGTPYQGLCIDKGIRCEDPYSYDTATNQSVECSASEMLGSRPTSLACPAPVTYNSPHHLGSGSSLTKPANFIIVLSTCLIHPVSKQIHLFILFFILDSYRLFYVRIMNLIFCFYFVYLDYSRINLLFVRLRRKSKTFFHSTIKFFKLIFNYFKFNSNKWQYYFILISVNLLFNLFNKNPEPFTTPSCLIDGLNAKKSEETRGLRHYFKHYYFPILSNIAQKLNEIIPILRKLCGLTKCKPLKLLSDNLVIETIKSHEKCIRIKQNSLTINRIKIYIIILKVLLIKDSHYRLKYENNERQKSFKGKIQGISNRSSTCFRYFEIRLMINSVQRTNVVDKSICLFLHNLRSYKYVWYYIIKSNINEKYSKKYFKRRLMPVLFKKTNPHIIIKWRRRRRKGGQKIKLKLVKSCQLMKLICSDPTCEFQTFFKKS